MGTISRQYTFIAGAIPSAANWNADPNNFVTLVNGQIDESNVDHSSADGICTLQNTQTISGTKTFSSSGGATFNYGITINDGSNDSDTRIETNNMANAVVVDAGLDAISFGAAAVDDSFVQIAKGATSSTATQNTYHLSVAPGGATTIPAGTTAYVGSVNINEPNITATGTVTNAFTVRIAGAPTEGGTSNYALWVDAGATQLDGTLSVGVDDTGADVKFFGATAGKHMLWDEDQDTLQLVDNTNLTFGTGNDADIFYDGTDLNISPAVVGAGDIVVNGASIEFADSEGVTLGTGKDATIQFDATNTVIATAAQLVLTPTTDTIFSNGTGVVVGHTAQETISVGDGDTDLVPEVQVLGTAAADASVMLAAFSTTATTAGSPILAFVKGGNGTIGSHTVVTDGEELGNIIAYGDDGTDLEAVAAQIQFEVDGTPGTGDMPGRIVMGTTADGAETATERLRIDKDGAITAPTNPAFLVTGPASTDNLTGDGTEHTVNFNSTVFDRGSDQATTTFTAPVTGIYSFNLVWNVGGPGTTTSHTSSIIKIVTSNRTHIVERINIGAVMVSTIHIGSASILTDMDATDTATITVTVTGAAANVDLNQITWSGKLEG